MSGIDPPGLDESLTTRSIAAGVQPRSSASPVDPGAVSSQTSLIAIRRRIGWIDCARGIAGAMVVYHHVCMGLWTAGLPFVPDPYSLLSSLLRTGRLPVLLFISGLFVVRSVQLPPTAFIFKRAKVLLYPYVIWYLIQSAFLLGFGKYVNFHPRPIDLLLQMFYRPYGQFWFLPALFLADVLFLILYRVGKSLELISILAIVLAIGANFIDLKWMPLIDKTLESFPYLAAGAMLSNLVLQRAAALYRPLLLTGFFATISLFLINPQTLKNGWMYYLILTPTATTVMLSLSMLIAKSPLSRPLEFLGRHSLEILLTHILGIGAARLFLVRILGVHGMIPHLVIGTIAGISVPMIFVWASRRFGMQFLFQLPSQSRSGTCFPESKR